ncbi:SHOCT domain-containing protein [Pseudonocardia alni]|uniref:SHOCT domain-containing protein n=1 Tax=Pseudonocardia alni TaxID=33907 RepID=UPI00399C92BF
MGRRRVGGAAAGGITTTFTGLPKDRVKAISDGIRSHLVPTGSVHVSVADELQKLSQLRASGVLSDSEFDEQKRRLLAR